MKSLVIPLALAAALAAACGPSTQQINEARTARYSCAQPEVVGALVASLNEHLQTPARPPDHDDTLIVTRGEWHDTNGMRKRNGVIRQDDYLFRLAAHLRDLGGAWLIEVEPIVLAQVNDSPQLSRIAPDNADWPPWATGRADTILLTVRRKLSHCAIDAQNSVTPTMAQQ